MNRETLLLVSLKPSCRFQPENQSSEFCLWPGCRLGCRCALPCCVFSFFVMLLLKAQKLAHSLRPALIREPLLCARRTPVQAYSEACSSLLEVSWVSAFLSCHPKKLGGNDDDSSWLWAPLQPQRLENSFWRWTIFPPDSLARLLSSSLLYLDPVARAIWEIWMFVVRLQEEKPLWCHLRFEFLI